MKRFAFLAAALTAVGLISWQFPMFHVLRRADVVAAKQAEAFNAAQVAETLWQEQLMPALADAANAADVFAALDENPDAARRQFGRTIGMSRATFFLVQGSGAVVAIEKSRIGLALDYGTSPDLWLLTGPVFGNAIRDSTGLILSRDYPNSQHFNALSTELNAMVETRVLAPLRSQAGTGAHIHFTACVEVAGGKITKPLQLIPLSATMLSDSPKD
jgi:predicted lipoprotein